MKITIDTDLAKICICGDTGQADRTLDMYTREGFELLSRYWVKVGWQLRYSYAFSWFGRPIIQLPEDLIRLQEVLYRVRPDVIIETGVAYGGSLVYYATLCKALGHGRVIGIDREIRPHNRAAIESHPLAEHITLVEGDSISPTMVRKVESLLRAGERGLVILDACHTKAHVAAELEAYQRFVAVDSYLVATDGIMHDMADVPRGQPAWRDDNPAAAAREFATGHPEFELAQPPWPFNESELVSNVTHWPGAWLRRLR